MKSENSTALEVEGFLKRSGATLKRMYFMKSGFIYLQPREKYMFFSDEMEKPGEKVCDELFRCLTNFQYVMETSPKENIKRWQELGDGDIQLYGSLEHGISALMSFIDVRFALPERVRKELPIPSEGCDWRPEQFHVLFNGSIFFVIEEINRFIRETDVGQVARELLKSAMSASELWEAKIVAPSPIHIDFYILMVDHQPESQELEFPTILRSKNDFVFILQDDDNHKVQINSIIEDMRQLVEGYYENRLSRKKLEDRIDELKSQENKLNTLLEQNYGMSAIRKFFTNKLSSEIRKTLSKMYQILNEISSVEIEIKKMDTRVLFALEKSPLIKIRDYFDRFLGEEKLFDKSVFLTAMNFAAEESTNMAMIQATLYAAFIGGIIGSVVTFLIQYFT